MPAGQAPSPPPPFDHRAWDAGPAKWFAVAVVGLLALGAAAAFRGRSALPLLPPAGSPQIAPAAPVSKINLNTADAGQLAALPGIGPALAGRILDYRQTHGLFRSVDDLAGIKGIGPKKLEALRPHAIAE